MKKIKYFHLLIFSITIFFAACGKEKVEPGVPLQDVTTEYKTEGTIRAVTALEDDTVFAVTVSPSGYQLSCFDGEGNCIDSFDETR